jgi:hypothetical protein
MTFCRTAIKQLPSIQLSVILKNVLAPQFWNCAIRAVRIRFFYREPIYFLFALSDEQKNMFEFEKRIVINKKLPPDTPLQPSKNR